MIATPIHSATARNSTGRSPLRRSTDKVWPLRCADGRTWAQVKADAARDCTPLPRSPPRT